MRNIILIFFVFLFGCQSNTKTIKTTKTKIFGDTLKIEYTYIGDTVYQKRTDLKKKQGVFDNNFDVKSVWNTKTASFLNCEQKIKITKAQLDYIFCLDAVLEQSQKELVRKTELNWNKDSILFLQKELLKIEKGELDSVSSQNYFMIFNLIRNIPFTIYDQKTKTNVSKISIENYTTPFSGGHIYYLINKKHDTLAKYHFQDWKNSK